LDMSEKTCRPLSVFSGVWNTGHCQGIAVDEKNQWVYYSFTTALVKTDLQGNLLGTVTGLLGHLGCIALNPADGKVYGSLEYKNDAIGKGILNHLGSKQTIEDAFFIVSFQGEKITREGMDAARDGVMKAVYLKEVVGDYLADVTLEDGRTAAHRYGCSGIDGVTFGPVPGSKKDSRWDLWVAYGIYGDVQRPDNDYQVLLRYDISHWDEYAAPLVQENMHHQGPEAPDGKYFLFTGNTTYGVQNLEYDPFTGHYLLAVYRGQKDGYPNAPMYVMDGGRAPQKEVLKGLGGEEGDVLYLAEMGQPHPSGVYSFPYDKGQTGLCALGDGEYYVSYDENLKDGWSAELKLCRWDGERPLAEE